MLSRAQLGVVRRHRRALAAGAHDESVRAVINYLWSAGTLGGLDPVEQFVNGAVGRLAAGLTAEAYDRYLHLSLASLIYVPAGRWAKADAVIPEAGPTQGEAGSSGSGFSLGSRSGEGTSPGRSLLARVCGERIREQRAPAHPPNGGCRDAARDPRRRHRRGRRLAERSPR